MKPIALIALFAGVLAAQTNIQGQGGALMEQTLQTIRNLNQNAVQKDANGNVTISGTVSAANIGIDPTIPPYNAVCNGSTDDSTALQAAITAAAAAQVPLMIRKVCAASGLSLPSNAAIYGYPGAALKHNGAGSTALLSVATSASNIQLMDLELQGAATDATTQTVGVWVHNSTITDVRLVRVNVHNFNQNITVDGASAVSGIDIGNSQIHDAIGTTAGHGYGVIATGVGVSNVRVHDSVFTANQRHAVYFAGGVSRCSADFNSVFHSVSGSSFALTSWSGTPGSPSSFIRFAGNRLFSPYGLGIGINDGVDHVEISSNQIYDPQSSSAQCILINSTAPGSLDAARFVTVRNNYCRTAQTAPGVQVIDSTDILIEGNTVEGGTGGYGYLIGDSGSNASARINVRNNLALGAVGYGIRVNNNGASPAILNIQAPQAQYSEWYDGSGGTGPPSVKNPPYIQAADPGCTVASDLSKVWLNTTTTTTVFRVCLNVSGTVGWVTK